MIHRHTYKTQALCSIALGALAIALPGTAQAQEAPAASENQPAGTIVVTARNRAESIQEVPMSITALSDETMEKKSVEGMSDIARFTPGLSFENYSSGFQVPVIRAQAQTSVTALETNVATFYDGIYMPRSWSVDMGVAALDRVEVVKGPQSARYGRNAFAGAVNFIAYKATTEGGFTAEGEVTAGIYDRYDASVKAKLPISDQFGLAATYNHSEFDGTWKNSNPWADAGVSPGTNGRIGGWNNDSWSVSAIARPTDGMVIEASYSEFDIERESNPNADYEEASGQLNCGAIRASGNPSLMCGEVPGTGSRANVDPRSYGAWTSTQIARIHAAYEFAPHWNASYLFGRVTGDVSIGNMTVSDPSNCVTSCVFQNAPVGEIDYDSHEWRVDYDGSSFDFAFGGFISKGDDDYNFNLVYAPPLSEGQPVVPFTENATLNLTLTNTTTTTLVRSVFGETQWTSPSGNLRLGAEGRYSWTDLSVLNNRNGMGYADTFRAFTPRFTAEFDASADTLLYASAARGTKAGGFNATAASDTQRTYGEESNWTYEVGAKNTLMGGRLTFNAALFYTDWSDIQINSADTYANDPNAVNIVLNLGSATVYGAEFDTAFYPDEHWSFDANFSYAHGEYSDETVDARFSRTVSPCDGIVCTPDGSVGGNQIERTPRAKGSFGAQWQTELPWDNGSFFLRGDVSWQDKMYTTPANEATIPSRTLFNARSGISFGNFDLSIWARNVFDKKYVSNAYVVLLPSGNSYQLFYGERRTMGLTLKAKY
ncbi:TonB-dependent receptor [Novosphingobium decolorationis]|uniref:TonB-dependent receptor n=1 Tax=Novosphingobium decolorationis TaxID=2698673 RepID=A0ABX8E460_9SPHN|nr:TonB-dependent receptor [Novosphingobium decolorationis]MED5544652.1 TonB-dependent receptor [Pseudomonadota bacterium]QVM83926.1 TonB-dependent receptor [Novosphingobium decolorationis]